MTSSAVINENLLRNMLNVIPCSLSGKNFYLAGPTTKLSAVQHIRQAKQQTPHTTTIKQQVTHHFKQQSKEGHKFWRSTKISKF